MAASGRLPPPADMELWARLGARGPLGETMLHWALFHGDAQAAKAWLGAGGEVARDAHGALPLHWLARAPRQSAVADILGEPKARAGLARWASEPDALGRDALGIMCLALAREGLCAFARAYPEAAQAGVAMGLGARVGLADALCANLALWSGQPALEALVSLVEPPSERLPEAIARGGSWTQPLWELAVSAFSTSSQRARAEARAIARGVAPAPGSAPGSSGRL